MEWKLSNRTTRLACIAALSALALGGCATQGMHDKSSATAAASTRSGMEPAPGTLSRDEIRHYQGVRASTLLNRRVANMQGEFLGQIQDLVVHMSTGDVRYAVLAVPVGEQDRLYAVPLDRLKMRGGELRMDIAKAQLARQKGWSPKQWPDLQDRAYWGEIDRLSGWPAVQPAQAYYAYRASELIGKDVDNLEGRHLGRISDLVLDLNRSDVHYAVMRFEPHVGVSTNQLFAVPIHALIFRDGNTERVALNVKHDRVAKMAGFDPANWPALNDPHYLERLQQTWIIVFPQASAGVGATK